MDYCLGAIMTPTVQPLWVAVWLSRSNTSLFFESHSPPMYAATFIIVSQVDYYLSYYLVTILVPTVQPLRVAV